MFAEAQGPCSGPLPTVLNGRFPTNCSKSAAGTICSAICNPGYGLAELVSVHSSQHGQPAEQQTVVLRFMQWSLPGLQPVTSGFNQLERPQHT